MSARTAVALCALLAAFAAPPAMGQVRLYRVGLLANTIPMAELTSGVTSNPAPPAIREGLRELGWTEGKNIELVWRTAEGDLARLPALAEELVRSQVDVIVAWGPGVEAVARKTDRIPIVMGASAVTGREPRIDSLARPGHNVTGMTLVAGREIDGKRLALIREIAPRARSVAWLTQAPMRFSDVTVEAARTLAFRLEAIRYASESDLEDAFLKMARGGIDFVVVGEEPVSNLPETQRAINRAARHHRMPLMYQSLTGAENGGLAAYGQDIRRLYRRTPYFIDRILRGTKAGDIPIEQPARFELWVNRAAAAAIGITFPPSVLTQADRVIE